MSGDSMDMEESRAETIQSLQALATGPFSSSLSTLSSSSKALPSDKDFHFFYNFDEFKLPISEIAEKSQSMLESIGSSTGIWGDKPIIYPQSIEIDGDDAYDWLVNINDEIFERFDVSIDEFQRVRKKEEETGRSLRSVDVDNGFQLVYGKKKKKGAGDSMSRRDESASSSGVSVKKTAASVGKAKVGKAKVPFHIPTIRKPQEAYNILVNNANQPFEHVWLQRSDDGQRVIHPLEKLSVMDFVDKDMVDVDPVEPPSIEATPFKLVEEVKDLKELSAKLRNVNEFAVDLEHNQYRSFQGLTCLMQISTRTEDFIVDTLKLRIHMGPYLREIFKDPTKKKVMHGADRDILWLQRDFGIYICNLFDTGQASRVLKLERNSLEYLLHNFCGVTANKEYQNADWRLRPLPHEMVRYAREDTHYLLYIYDIMKSKLQSMLKESDHSDAPLAEVYKRSYDVCMLLYEKELLTETSYLHIYGLQEASFDAEQLAVVAGLCKWRDVVARAEDESTGYILPNKTLLEIAKQMPRSEGRLRKLLKSKHPYVERNIGSVLNIIKHSTQNSAAFEAALHQLRGKHVSGEISAHKKRAEHVETEIEITEKTEDVVKTADCLSMQAMTPQLKQEESESGNDVADHQQDECSLLLKQLVENGTSTSARDSVTTLSCVSKEIIVPVIPPPKVVVGATVPVLKKPSRGLGALIGSASSKRKIDISKKDKEEIKLEQIRSSVNLPFHSFSGEQLSKPELKQRASVPEISQSEEPSLVAYSHTDLRDTIMLDSSPDAREVKNGSADKTDVPGLDNSAWSCLDANEDDDPVSLADLSTSFEKCFQPIKQTIREGAEKSKEPEGLLQFEAFDYEAARKQVRFGINAEKKSGSTGENQGSLASRRKDSDVARDKKDDWTGELRQGGRRQAFPASGNRSATFRS